MLGSLGAARRAYREHERVLELDPRRKDAGLIVGMYRYAVAALPAPLRLMARLAGFGGGRERGLRLVEEAARYPSDVQPNALFTLILLYNREARYDDALRRDWRAAAALSTQSSALARGGRHRAAGGAPRRSAGGARRRARAAVARRRGRGRRRGSALAVRLRRGARRAEGRRRPPSASFARRSTGATRDWVRGRAHKELGKLADLAGDRPRALEEYRLADRLCRQDHDSECSDEVKRLIEDRCQ